MAKGKTKPDLSGMEQARFKFYMAAREYAYGDLDALSEDQLLEKTTKLEQAALFFAGQMLLSLTRAHRQLKEMQKKNRADA